MDKHLITSDGSENELNSTKTENETVTQEETKTEANIELKNEETFETSGHSNMETVLPSTSAHVMDNIEEKNSDNGSTKNSINKSDDSLTNSIENSQKRCMILLKRFNAVLLHVFIPLNLLTCVFFKISIQSLVSMIMFFIFPFFFPINKRTISRRLKNFIIILIVLSCLSLFLQLAFQIFLLSNQPYANPSILPNCSIREELLEEIGYSRLDTAFIYDIFRIIVPDVFLLITSIITLITCQKLNRYNAIIKLKELSKKNVLNTKAFTNKFCPLTNVAKEPSTGILTAQITTSQVNIEGFDTNEDSISSTNENPINADRLKVKKKSFRKSMVGSGMSPIKRFLKSIIPFILHITFLALIFLCGALWPSLLAIPYFIFFLFFTTKWSLNRLNQYVSKTDYAIKLFLVFYIASHVMIYYMYQLRFFQAYAPPDSLVSRLLGLNQVLYATCAQPAHFYFNDNWKWQQLAYPFALISLYWFITLEFSYSYENMDKDSILSPPRSPPIPTLPSIAVGRMINENNDPVADDSIANNDNENVLEITETQHLFRSDENLTSNSVKRRKALEIPLRKKRNSMSHNLTESSSMIEFNQERLRIGQLVLNLEFVREYLSSCAKFFMKQSYLLSLISMMAWSISFHSILAFVLLIWACFIWVLPSSRKWCLKTSPLFVFYTTNLLCLEFIYGLQLNDDELPQNDEIGIVRHQNPFFTLSFKVGLMLFYWLTLHQYLTERRNEIESSSFNPQESTLRNTASESALDLVKKRKYIKEKVITWIQHSFIKYWILLSSGMLLLMSCQNPVVAYRIGYMILFLYFISAFQIAHSFWRYSLFLFHAVVVIYSMLVLLLIYIFQFEKVQDYFKNHLGFSEAVLQSIGFERLLKDELALRLLTPTTFLIVNIIQIHYFNAPWMKLTDFQQIEPESTIANPIDQLGKNQQEDSRTCPKKSKELKREEFLSFAIRIVRQISHLYSLIISYLWRVAEIHIYKVIIIIVGVYCLQNVTLLNLVLFSLVLFSLLIDRFTEAEKPIRAAFSGIILIWVCIQTICTMVYQLKFIVSPLVTNCSGLNDTQDLDPFLLKDEDNLEYLGIRKSEYIAENLTYYIIIFLMLTAQKIIKIKSKYNRLATGKISPTYSVIFEKITWKELDLSIVNFFKYLINFFFYRFGLEICFFMTAIVIIVRMDAYALLYGAWLGIFLRMKRKTICNLWTSYFVFLIILLILQYIERLGLPPVLCYQYPWSVIDKHKNNFNKLRIWLFLPDYSNPPDANMLVADFFQVFFVWLQLSVFRIEIKAAALNGNHITIQRGGRNDEIIYDSEMIKQNPYHDFISQTRHYLDKFKYGFYMYSYWLVLSLVFYTGTSRISILCMGYVVLSFFFFWYGQTFLIKPIKKLIKLWNILVFYCFVVIFTKACLQIVLCLLTDHLDKKSIDILIDLFGVDCRTLPKTPDNQDDTENVGLIWDVLCFIILLIQRRIYMSYMFQYVVNEYKAQSTLAARGAEIFKDIIQRRVRREKYKEAKEFKRLKERVERIKQKRIKQNHAKSLIAEQAKEPQDYYTSIRSGDYYMFESEFEISDSDSSNESDYENTGGRKSRSSEKNEQFNDEADNRAKSSLVDELKDTGDIEHKIEKKSKKTHFDLKTRTSKISKNSEDLVEIQLLAPLDNNENNKSWLTIENKTALNTVYYIKKGLLILIDFIINVFNKYSKDFRIVSHILAKEKFILKTEYDNSPTPALIGIIKDIDKDKTNENQSDQKSSHESLPFHQWIEKEDNNKIIQTASNEIAIEMNSQSRLDKLMSGLFYYLLSQSELICYFFLILNHLMTATVLSSPLPIGVFLWAMLGVPRPKKSFWITTITYIEAIVVIKYIFQFKIFSWNQKNDTAAEIGFSEFATILGIDRKEGTSQFNYDLLVLVVIFLHRTILKNMGLWRNSSTDDDALIAKNDENGNTNSIKENGEDKDSNDAASINGKDSEDESDAEIDSKLAKKPKKRMVKECKIEKKQVSSDENVEYSSDTEYEDLENDDLESDKKTPIKTRIKKKAQTVKNQSLFQPFIQFYEDLNTKHYAVVTDCYAKMFMCDFINVIIIIFSYQNFSSSGVASLDKNAINSITENKVPTGFLYLFLMQFIIMIIDRALYLRKNLLGKFFFQLILVIGFHIWIFLILPIQTKLRFLDNVPSQFYYVFKCIYFGFSSRQIRCGFPKRILGNFVTKSYNYINLILFKGFLLVPFLLELRSLMDWMFTDTSFSLFDWLQMEDIYSNIFVLKCNRYNEAKYPILRGQKRNALIKYGFGGLLLTIIILIMLGPLLLFTFSEGFKRSVPPSTFKVDLEFAGFLPIYSMTSQQRLFKQFTDENRKNLRENSPKEAIGFFNDFRNEDIYCISIPGNSTSLWQLSPPSLSNLKQLLENQEDLKLDFIYELTRESTEENEQLSETVNSIKSSNVTNTTKAELYDVLSGFDSDKSIIIHDVYPRFSHARVKGNIVEIPALKSNQSTLDYYASIKLTLKNETNQLWWDVVDAKIDSKYKLPCHKSGHLNMVIFSDPISPSSISFITEQGIIGIYITIVLAVSRLLRFMVVNSSMRIMFEQLPNVDRILKLLESIYVVRENKNFLLEEKLFSKLIFLYRSTEMMIKYTRLPDDSKNKKTL